MTTNHTEEKELLLLLRDGDGVAFEQLYMQYSKPLLWKMDKMVKDVDLAEELLQDLFVKVWERRKQVDIDQPFPAYLYRIAQHMVTDHYRKLARTAKARQHVKRQLDDAEQASTVEEFIYSGETGKLLDEAIAMLPEQRKLAFTLCKLQGKSHKEAAIIMKISPNTVHNHLVKASSSIRIFLENSHKTSHGTIALLLAISFYLAKL